MRQKAGPSESSSERIVFGTKGRRFMFVDTCHAAGAYNVKLGNEAYHNDITAFTATGQDEEALELPELKQGVFSYAIARGLGPEAKSADTNGDNQVSVDELAQFLAIKTSAVIDQYYPGYEAKWKLKKPKPQLYRARDALDHVLAQVE